MEVQPACKSCAACGASKPIGDFYIVRGKPISYCKPCDNRRRVDARGGKPRPAKVPHEEMLARRAAYTRRWMSENKGRHAAYKRARARLPEVALRNRMSKALRRCMRGAKQQRSSFQLLGFTAAELKTHLERQFVKGMGWHNMGEWHIDHIVPLREFDATAVDSDGFRRAWALTNLRPLWAKENCSKNGKRIFLI